MNKTNMAIITRFAPSPTGMLHIGGARTALFNWLFARHFKGKFLLRIEDTDKERSKPEFNQAIIDSLNWLGLNWDSEIVYQAERIKRHQEIAAKLLDLDAAYYCACTKDELELARYEAKRDKKPLGYNGKCRELDLKGKNMPLRLKIDRDGYTEINDLLQSNVKIKNSELEDFIILRNDGSPTYMLSVVVDDFDMNITHIIRGDDHLNNAFKQKKIYQALNWNIPEFCHIPLIHSMDGKKFSKRHGAVNVCEFKKNGILPEAFNNTLLRLGWAHGNDEIIDIKNAISWFSINGMNKSAARFDIKKLEHLNQHYIKISTNDYLLQLLIERFPDCKNFTLNLEKQRLKLGLTGIKLRAKKLK